MEHYSLDITKRMKEIKRQLDAAVSGGGGGRSEEADGDGGAEIGTAAPSDGVLEELLEELCEAVEDVDCARDLALIGGLPTLLSLIKAGGSGGEGGEEKPEPRPLISSGVVARAAEALGTAAQSNPPVQDWFLEGGALEAVLGLLRRGAEEGEAAATAAAAAASAEVRQKALLALSCLARNCDKGADALIAAGGVETILEHALAAVGEGEDLAKGKESSSSSSSSSSSVGVAPRVARKAFRLLASLFRDRPTEGCLRPALSGDEVSGGGKFARAAARALRNQGKENGDDAEVRLAAAAAVESLAKAASEAGISIENDQLNPFSLLLRAALETAESTAAERASVAGERGDEHGRDWAEEEREACCAALRALSLKPREKKEVTEEEGERKAVLSLPAAPSGS